MEERERSALRHRYQMYHRQGPGSFYDSPNRRYYDFEEEEDSDEDLRRATFDEIMDRNGPLPATSSFLGRFAPHQERHREHEHERSEGDFHRAPLSDSSTTQLEQQQAEEDDQSGEEVCRVCRCESTPDQPLFYPCLCKGSIRYIHQDCLTMWLKHSNKTSCELCKHPFTFQPVYAENAPKILAGHELVFGLVKKAARSFKHALRLLAVLLVWLVVIPVGTSWIWRWYFTAHFSPSFSLSDGLWGGFLALAIFLLFLALSCLLEYLEPAPGGLLEGAAARLQHPAWDVPDEEVPAHAPMGAGGGDRLDIDGAAGAQDGLNADDEFGEEELEFREIVGLHGPYWRLIHKLALVLVTNAAVLGLLVLLPSWIGHLVLKLLDQGVVLFDHQPDDAGVVVPEAGEELQVGDQKELLLKTVAIGYCLIASTAFSWLAWILLTHNNLGQARPLTKRIATCLHVILVVLKVAVLVFVELGVFPEMCGWFLDLATIPALGATWEARMALWHQHPHLSTFMHWCVGFAFMCVLSSALKWLRSALRPGVLWFLRMPEDPDYDFLQELINVPVLRQIRRTVLTVFFFGSIIALSIYVPVRAASMIPSLLPLNVLLSIGHFNNSSDLVLFHIVAPLLFKYARPTQKLKAIFLRWLQVVGDRLGLTSYLFPSLDEHGQQKEVQYPTFFAARIVALLVAGWALIGGLALVMLAVPLTLGRLLFAAMGVPQLCDFYAIFAGCAMMWAIHRGTLYAMEHLAQHNSAEMTAKMKDWACVGAKCAFVGFFWLLLIPLMIGTLFDVTITLPVRVPWLDQCAAPNPPFQSWALGLFCLKLWHKAMTRDDESTWKRRLDKVTQNGYANINVMETWTEVLWPISVSLALALFLPHFVAVRLVPFVTSSFLLQTFCERFCYLVVVFGYFWWEFCWMLKEWLVKLHNSIRDEKYLIGSHLQNYTTNLAATEQQRQ